jgi:hypothetical protein
MRYCTTAPGSAPVALTAGLWVKASALVPVWPLPVSVKDRLGTDTVVSLVTTRLLLMGLKLPLTSWMRAVMV